MYFLLEQLPVEFSESIVFRWLIAFLFMTARYMVFAGSLYSLFYVWKRRDWFYLKIQQKYPEKKRILYEMRYSLSSFAIFSLIVTLFALAYKGGYTKIYVDVAEYGWGYLVFSFAAGLLIHDTYFYWIHRLMHHKLLFKHVHKVHHMSHNPTPFAAFSFHPIEAVLEFGFVPLTVMLMPIHPLALAGVSLYMIVMNVMGHVGFEIFPKGATKHWLFGLHNSSTHHNMHHKYVNCNYGLYFNVWDKLMNTNHAKYHETFEAVKARPKPIENEEESNSEAMASA